MCKMNYMASRFFCTSCGKEGLTVYRNKGQKRADGHLKNMYCIYCKSEHNFAEVKGTYTPEVFQKEFELGRFIDGVRIPVNDLKTCGNTECHYNVSGRCWNCSIKDCDERK